MYWSLFWELGDTFETSFFHLKTLREFLNLDQGMRMGHVTLNLKSVYTRLAWPTHPNRISYITWNHSLFMIIWALRKHGWFLLILKIKGFETNPWFHLLYFTNIVTLISLPTSLHFVSMLLTIQSLNSKIMEHVYCTVVGSYNYPKNLLFLACAPFLAFVNTNKDGPKIEGALTNTLSYCKYIWLCGFYI